MQKDAVTTVFALWDTDRDEEATAMLAEHELADSQVENDVIVQWDRRLYREDTPTIVPDERLVLAHYVAIHNRCQVMVTSRENVRYIRFIGYSADVATDILLYRFSVGEMLDGIAGLGVESLRKKEREAFQIEFGETFAWKMHKRLSAVKAKVDETARANGLHRELESRRRNVMNKYRETYPNLTVVQFPKYKSNETDGGNDGNE